MPEGAGSAILLGADSPIGLTIIRELGLRGVAVHAIGSRADAIGLRSRYVTAAYVRSGAKRDWATLIRSIHAATGARHILAVGENDIAFLNEYFRDDPVLVPLVPTADKMAIVLDKARCYGIAAALDIETPTVWNVDTSGDLDAQLAEVRLPVVLKWANPHDVVARLENSGLDLHKFEYFYDLPGLKAALQAYRQVGIMPLVQAYCPGYGLGQMVFMHKGQPLLTFQHRRLHEWPPEGGFSTLCESLSPQQHPEQMALSVALLRAVGWEGAAMVEYRYDPVHNRFLLMEINGRFWGSQPLAFHAGAHFGWLTYAVMGQGIVPDLPPAKAWIRCRYLIPDIKRLLRILFRPGRIQDRSLRFDGMAEIRNLCGYFGRSKETSYVWWRDDPAPFFADLRHAAGRALQSLMPGRRA
jgi:predicted ATP-grasp superfamily ATP-dependent carboligase